ncbi:MAG: glycosyltransferase family 4 protein [Alphaproteobacteria bacterium]
MKIFYFSGATLPSDSAQSVHVMKMCAALAQDSKSNAVTLFAKGAPGSDDEAIFNYYGIEPCFSLILPVASKIPVLSGMLRLSGHRLALKETGMPDIAYGRDPVALNWLIPENIPVIYEAHQVPRSFLEKRAVKNLLQQRRLMALVVISNGLKTDFIKAFPKLRQSKIFVAPDGADISVKNLAPRELAGCADALKVGYTGSLHEGKGMEIIALLAKEAKDFDFHVVGGSLQQVQAWRKDALPNLFMHGHVPHGELGAYLAAFDVLIAPYRTRTTIKTGVDISKWMSPMKIFEYMAAKKPIMASDLPVIREILKDGENALLLSPSEPRAWIAALEKLKDEGLRNSLAARAYADLQEKYTWKKRARAILKFVDKGN